MTDNPAPFDYTPCGVAFVSDPDYPCILAQDHPDGLFYEHDGTYSNHCDQNGETW